jgi:hypothetical protein
MFGAITDLHIRRRGILLLVGAALAATVMAPVAARDSAASAPAVTTYTRWASCAGLSFYPLDYADGYGAQGTLRTRPYSDNQGDGYFLCDPGLPNGAVVTKVQFTVRDAHFISDMTNCALVRSSLIPSRATIAEVLAGPLGTSEEPGDVRLIDDSIAFATINNAKFGYWLQCRIEAAPASGEIGLYGANVTYTITATNG